MVRLKDLEIMVGYGIHNKKIVIILMIFFCVRYNGFICDLAAQHFQYSKLYIYIYIYIYIYMNI